jgi:hypothetical protein
MLWDGEDARVLGDYLSVSRTGRPDPLLKSSTDSVTISYKAALHDARFPKGVLHVRACPKYYGDAPWYDCVVINAGGPEVDEMIAEPAARNRYFAQVRSIVTSASGAISLFVRYFIPRFPLHHWFGECDGYNFPEVSHPPPYLSALPPLKNKYPLAVCLGGWPSGFACGCAHVRDRWPSVCRLEGSRGRLHRRHDQARRHVAVWPRAGQVI